MVVEFFSAIREANIAEAFVADRMVAVTVGRNGNTSTIVFLAFNYRSEAASLVARVGREASQVEKCWV